MKHYFYNFYNLLDSLIYADLKKEAEWEPEPLYIQDEFEILEEEEKKKPEKSVIIIDI